MMPRGLTANKAEWLAKALRVELVPLSVLAPYLPRDLDVNHMELIAMYLRRVERYYLSAWVSA
jgi:hypothetical protein